MAQARPVKRRSPRALSRPRSVSYTHLDVYKRQAADGVIVIKTKAKSSRTQFRDYAFWVPNFFTDKAGKGAIKIAYPDNVTGWKTFVLGMDKKRRMGKATIFTQAYKPMTAQLNKPEFLLQGDSSYFVTKLLNYTDDTYDVTARFFANLSLIHI